MVKTRHCLNNGQSQLWTSAAKCYVVRRTRTDHSLKREADLTYATESITIHLACFYEERIQARFSQRDGRLIGLSGYRARLRRILLEWPFFINLVLEYWTIERTLFQLSQSNGEALPARKDTRWTVRSYVRKHYAHPTRFHCWYHILIQDASVVDEWSGCQIRSYVVSLV